MHAHGPTKDWEFWLGVAVVILALIGLALVPSQVLDPRFGSRSIAFSPRTFPTITLSLMAVLGAAMAVLSALGKGDGRALPPEGLPKARALAPMLIMLAYVLLIERVGMVVTSAAAVAAIAFVLGNRNWLTILSLAIVSPLLVWLVFRVGLNVFLPEGGLFQGIL